MEIFFSSSVVFRPPPLGGAQITFLLHLHSQTENYFSRILLQTVWQLFFVLFAVALSHLVKSRRKSSMWTHLDRVLQVQIPKNVLKKKFSNGATPNLERITTDNRTLKPQP